MNKQSGFTIIELVVVIALLGILAAVALPRFVNVTEDAHNAAVEGTAGGFAAGVALVKAKAVVENAQSGDSIDLDGVLGVTVNATGYPVSASGGDASIDDADECVEIWDVVLQGSRPAASTGLPSPSDGSVKYVASTTADGCQYRYYIANTSNNATTERDIDYNASNGEVETSGTVDN